MEIYKSLVMGWKELIRNEILMKEGLVLAYLWKVKFIVGHDSVFAIPDGKIKLRTIIASTKVSNNNMLVIAG